MITHTGTFETLANAPVKTARVRFIDRDPISPINLEPDADLEEVGYKNMGSFLGAGSKEITAKLIGDYSNVAGRTYGVYLGIYDSINTVWEELRLGEFTVTSSVEYDAEADRTIVKMRDPMFIAQETEYLLNDDDFDISGDGITVQELATLVCTYMGWVLMPGFSSLPNASYVITQNLWGTINEATMRSVIVEIAEATGTTAVITYADNKWFDGQGAPATGIGIIGDFYIDTDTDDYYEKTAVSTWTYVGTGATPEPDPILTFRQYNVETQTMNESNLKKFKVGEHYGGLNQIVLSRMPQGDNEVSGYTTDIDLNGVTSFSIINNEIVDDDRTTTIAPLYTSLINDAPFIEFDDLTLDTVGHGWYEIGDSWTVTVVGVDYIPFVTEHTMTINGGIKETIVSKIPTQDPIDRQTAGGITKTLYDTTIKVDRQNNEITSLISELETLDNETQLSFSEVQQTIDNVTTSIQTTGGGNLIKNSVGYGDQSYTVLNATAAFWLATGSGTDPTLTAATITGAGSSAWGTSGFTSVDPVYDELNDKNNVTVSGAIDQSNLDVAIGFTDIAMTDRDDLVAGMYFNSDATIDIYSSGVLVSDNISSYSASDTFGISFIDDMFHFYLNDILIYSMAADLLSYYVAGDFYAAGSVSQLSVTYASSILSSWYYSVTDATSVISTDSTNYGAQSGSEIQFTGDSLLQQHVQVANGSQYSLSFYATKSSAGVATIKLYNEIDSYETVLPDSTPSNWTKITMAELTASMNYFNIAIITDGVASFEITDIMLNAGPIAQTWQQAAGEILNTQVAIDNSGIRVRSSIYEGMESAMTPIEFAVYNNDTKVFEASPDGIGTSNIYNRGVLEFPNMRLIPITTGSNQGLAFVLKQE